MKVSGMLGADLDMAPLAIAELEQRGYDAAFTAEINNDPFFPLVLAAEHSKTIALTTSISVAFARNPMTLANLAWDLNQYSKGRFTVGLGSQIKPHITRRFSMPWSKPAARMREFIQAMQAIWRCWETGEKLDFNGEFYRHNLMTPDVHAFQNNLRRAGGEPCRRRPADDGSGGGSGQRRNRPRLYYRKIPAGRYTAGGAARPGEIRTPA